MLAPFVLAMVLGDKAEDAFRQAMLTSDGSSSIFWSNGLVTTMMLIGCFLIALPAISVVIRYVSDMSKGHPAKPGIADTK